MVTSLDTRIRRMVGTLVAVTVIALVAAGSTFAGGRPAASYYTKQQLQAMSQRWAARGALSSESNVQAALASLPCNLLWEHLCRWPVLFLRRPATSPGLKPFSPAGDSKFPQSISPCAALLKVEEGRCAKNYLGPCVILEYFAVSCFILVRVPRD